MTREQFFNALLNHLELPFKIEDVTDMDVNNGVAMITVSNDEHPYIIRIEKMPIESDFKEDEREFFWKDQSGRGFSNTFNAQDLYDAFEKEVDDRDDFQYWIDTCEIGEEYDSGTPNEIKRIK